MCKIKVDITKLYNFNKKQVILGKKNRKTGKHGKKNKENMGNNVNKKREYIQNQNNDHAPLADP
jgi:hypothetical protein